MAEFDKYKPEAILEAERRSLQKESHFLAPDPLLQKIYAETYSLALKELQEKEVVEVTTLLKNVGLVSKEARRVFYTVAGLRILLLFVYAYADFCLNDEKREQIFRNAKV